ncbi:MAG: spermidine synthase [Pseudomonadota bacterium]
MALPWQIIESIPTEEGILELRRRSDRDFLITVGGRVLMNSLSHRSEVSLGQLACGHLKSQPGSKVLVGGLGMGYTLRAVLDHLPEESVVWVAELNPVVLEWCRGPLAHLTAGAVKDSRVTVEIADVALLIQKHAKADSSKRLDAIVLDLYTGPYVRTHKRNDPLYGSVALQTARVALKPDGVFAVWGEDYDAGFEKRLREAGFSVTNQRLRGGGPRHVVYLGKTDPPGRSEGGFRHGTD